jgi:hypothetical protein
MTRPAPGMLASAEPARRSALLIYFALGLQPILHHGAVLATSSFVDLVRALGNPVHSGLSRLPDRFWRSCCVLLVAVSRTSGW